MDFVIITLASLTCLWLVMRHYEKRVAELQARNDALLADLDAAVDVLGSMTRHPATLRAVK